MLKIITITGKSPFKMRNINLTIVGLFSLAFYVRTIYTESFLNTTNTTLQPATNFDLNETINGIDSLVTSLDRFRGFFVLARHLSLWRTYGNMKELYRNNRKNGKMQPVIPEDVRFPCNLTDTRSAIPPTSIHRLRPGDIDVIASFGDSLTAGNGIISSSLLHILNEYRGLVFSGGGFGTWRNLLTLPNILKVFNPRLYGFSTGNGLVVDEISHLNIAEPMLMTRDLPYQASVLVSRMLRDPHINMKNHWKLLTIFIGCNDICSDMCHHSDIKEFLFRQERDLRHTLTILRDQVPRLLINLLPTPNMVTTLYKMQNIPLPCQLMHAGGCSCIFSSRYNKTYMERISTHIRLWQKLEQRISALSEFQTDNFAVIYHPFTESPKLKRLENGNIDLRYFASDCFHFSQLGHACMANSLWNSMLQPVGQKQLHLTKPFEQFECPTVERPYIATMGNN